MPEIYRSPIHVLYYYPEIKLFKQIFTERSGNMNWPEYKRELTALAEQVQQYNPHLILVDARHFRFIIVREMQDWINDNVIEILKRVGVQKWAVIATTQFVSQVSLEQTIELRRDNSFQAQYFDREQDALDWLLNNKDHANAFQTVR